MTLKKPDYGKNQESSTYTPHLQGDELDSESGRKIPMIQEPTESPGEMRKTELSREHSMSAENLSELGKLENSHLVISETSRAYSDSQLFPAAQVSTESMEKDHPSSSSASPSSSPLKMEHRHRQGARLSAAKLHLKSLFTQSPHSSNSNLANTEHKDSAKERRSHIPFMHQWSQVGHSKKRKFNHDELGKWAESLNSLLACPTGVSVFGAFLRSEFSEENLEFWLACEEYRVSPLNLQKTRACSIYSQFINPDAPQEVNLDAETREALLSVMDSPCADTFNKAQQRIYSLMAKDSFPRFLRSHHCMEAIKAF